MGDRLGIPGAVGSLPSLSFSPRPTSQLLGSRSPSPSWGWVARALTPAADLGCLRAAREPLRIWLPGNQTTVPGLCLGLLGVPQAIPGGCTSSSPSPSPTPTPPHRPAGLRLGLPWRASGNPRGLHQLQPQPQPHPHPTPPPSSPANAGARAHPRAHTDICAQTVHVSCSVIILVDICLGVGLLNMVLLVLVPLGTSILFSIVALPTHIPTNGGGEFPFLHILSSICYLQTFP